MTRSFAIDCVTAATPRYLRDDVIVVVDVIRAATMAITAVELGHTCYVASSLTRAFKLAQQLENPLLAGELKGVMPAGFHMNNSPARLVQRAEPHRPLILLSSSGTQLLCAANSCGHVYVGSLRNYSALSEYIAARHSRVAIVCAMSRGEFREEDQLCSARLGAQLMRLDFEPETQTTADLVRHWRDVPVEACEFGNSIAYLRRSGQIEDWQFILAHVNDLKSIVMFRKEKVIHIPSVREAPAHTSAPSLAAPARAGVADQS